MPPAPPNWTAILQALAQIRAVIRALGAGLIGGVRFVRSTGNSTDRTAELRTILGQGGHIYLGPGPFVINGSLDIESNTHLQLHPLAVIQRSLSTPTSTQMIRIRNKSNVIIEGGVLDGNKQGPVPGIGGQCSGIAFAGSHDVVIRDMEVRNFPEDATDRNTGDQHGSYGDGIYIGSGGDTGYAYRIRISNVYSHGNERHALFIVAGKDIVIESCVFSDTTGDEPGSAVNLETGDAGVLSNEAMQNIVIRNCIMESSQLGVTANNHSGSYWHDLLFEGCIFRNNRSGGFSTGGAGLPQNNLRLVDCVAENNRNGSGFYSGGSVGIQFVRCKSEGNLGGHGFELYEPRDFLLRDCSAFNNGGQGIHIRKDMRGPVYGLIEGCRSFNNVDYGITLDSSIPFDSTTIAGLHIAHCRTGNLALLAPRPWVAGRNVLPDLRISRSGRIYECTAAGACATVSLPFRDQTQTFTVGQVVRGAGSGATGYVVSQSSHGASGIVELGAVDGTFQDNELITDPRGGSALVDGPQSDPGPTGTAADIVDGTAHWRYLRDLSQQDWGISIRGESARGVSVTRCFDHGNASGHIHEWPTGDANALFTTDLLLSRWEGQRGSPLTRARSVMGEDLTGAPSTPTPTTYYAAGKAAIPLQASAVTIGTPFCSQDDLVMVTPLDIDAALTRWQAVAADGSFTVTGNAAAADGPWRFQWEVTKRG